MIDDKKIVSDMVLLAFIDFILMKEGDITSLGDLMKLYFAAIESLQLSSYSGSLFADYMGVLARQMYIHKIHILKNVVEGIVIHDTPTTTA